MMINELAYAKLNISLDITGIRDDGYHNMVMIMQTVSICDNISIDLTDDGVIYAITNFPFVPGDERNLAVKAAKLFFEYAGINGKGAVIKISKEIPMGAGMAGGSADASAVLRALNREYGNPLSRDELLDVSEKVGSDVPFCTIGGTALAKGKGEKLSSLTEFPKCRIIVAKPDFSISTPELFRAIDAVKLKMHPDTQGIVQAINDGDLTGICRRMYNVFEDVPDNRMKKVGEIKKMMMDAGAMGSIMTGTGSAVYGIFEEDSETDGLKAELEKEYGFCEIAEPTGRLL